MDEGRLCLAALGGDVVGRRGRRKGTRQALSLRSMFGHRDRSVWADGGRESGGRRAGCWGVVERDVGGQPRRGAWRSRLLDAAHAMEKSEFSRRTVEARVRACRERSARGAGKVGGGGGWWMVVGVREISGSRSTFSGDRQKSGCHVSTRQ